MNIHLEGGDFAEAFAPVYDAVARAMAQAAHICAVPGDTSVALNLLDEAQIRQVNRDARGIDQPTDVLSFPMLELDEGVRGDAIAWQGFETDRDPATGDIEIGDILLCLPVARRQAAEYGHSLARECAFLAVHGLLHLLGYDHMTPGDEAEMMALAEEALSRVGMARGE